MNKGLIIPNGVSLEKHESDTVVFLTNLGYTVELIPRSQRQGVHTPDLLIDNTHWEMKSPNGKGKHSIQQILVRALKQSDHIILDLRRSKLHPEDALAKAQREFSLQTPIKRLWIITKKRELLDLKR